MRVVHCKKEPFDVYIGRPSAWGNPFTDDPKVAGKETTVLVESCEKAIELYEIYIRDRLANGRLDITQIIGKTLGCWCAPKPCHGDVLIRLCHEVGLHVGNGWKINSANWADLPPGSGLYLVKCDGCPLCDDDL